MAWNGLLRLGGLGSGSARWGLVWFAVAGLAVVGHGKVRRGLVWFFLGVENE